MEVNIAQRLVLVRTTRADVWASFRPNQFLPAPASKVTLCMRPENIKIWPVLAKPNSPNRYSGHIKREVARGSRYTFFSALTKLLRKRNPTWKSK